MTARKKKAPTPKLHSPRAGATPEEIGRACREWAAAVMANVYLLHDAVDEVLDHLDSGGKLDEHLDASSLRMVRSELLNAADYLSDNMPLPRPSPLHLPDLIGLATE